MKRSTRIIAVVVLLLLPVPPGAQAIDDPGKLLDCTAAYIRWNGVRNFLDEYYNFFGNANELRITKYNKALLRCLYSKVNLTKTPFLKEYIPALKHNLEEYNVLLAKFFESPKNTPGLSVEQRNFLAWHFSSNREYKTNHLDPQNNVHVVGWDKSDTVMDKRPYTLITYGLLQCIALIATSSDGSAYFSHNSGVLPTEVFKEIDVFVKTHPNPMIFSVGVNPSGMAGLLKHHMHIAAPIYVHHKGTDETTVWSIKLAKADSNFEISVNEVPLVMEKEHLSSYMHSIETTPFFCGRSEQIFPGADFKSIDFIDFSTLYEESSDILNAFPPGYLQTAPAS